MPSPLEPAVVSRIQQMLAQRGQGWVRLRTLFYSALCGSHRRAAPILRLSGITPVRKRIETLQGDLDLVLVFSDVSGSCMTADGEAVVVLIRPEFEDEPEARALGHRVHCDT
jgi:hypothetical protein